MSPYKIMARVSLALSTLFFLGAFIVGFGTYFYLDTNTSSIADEKAWTAIEGPNPKSEVHVSGSTTMMMYPANTPADAILDNLEQFSSPSIEQSDVPVETETVPSSGPVASLLYTLTKLLVGASVFGLVFAFAFGYNSTQLIKIIGRRVKYVGEFICLTLIPIPFVIAISGKDSMGYNSSYWGYMVEPLVPYGLGALLVGITVSQTMKFINRPAHAEVVEPALIKERTLSTI